MYDSRWMNWGVLLFWLASVSWLLASKVFPLMQSGQVPVQGVSVPEVPGRETVVDWEIQWQGQRIGSASSRGLRRENDTTLISSIVRLEELPVTRLAQELLGPIASMTSLGGNVGDEEVVMDIEVATHLEFDAFGHLERLRSDVDLWGVPDILQLRGEVQRDGLLLRATTVPWGGQVESRDGRVELFCQRLDVPADALVADALSPSPQLNGLHVGQEWTYRAVRPFPPSHPWQIVRARVTHLEDLEIEGQLEEVLVVTFTDASATELTAADAPFSTLWVRSSGMVVWQRLVWGKFEMIFDRQFVTRPMESNP